MDRRAGHREQVAGGDSVRDSRRLRDGSLQWMAVDVGRVDSPRSGEESC